MKRRQVVKAMLSGALLAGLPIPLTTARAALSNPRQPLRAKRHQRDVAIIGAGIAGLSAGYFLRDLDVVLLEAEQSVGGRSLTGQMGDRTFSKGAQYITSLNGALGQIITDLGLDPVEIPGQVDAIYRKGKVFIGEDEILQMFSDRGDLAALDHFLDTLSEISRHYGNVPDHRQDSLVGRLDRQTAREWLNALRLPPVYPRVLNNLARRASGANLDELSALGLMPILFALFKQTLADMNTDDQARVESGNYTFDGGLNQVNINLANMLGDRIRFNSAVIQLEKLSDGLGYRILYADGSGEGRWVEAKTVIFTSPAPMIMRIAAQLFPSEVLNLLDQVRYAPAITVGLYGSSPIYSPAFDLSLSDRTFITDIYDACRLSRLDNPDVRTGAVSSVIIPAERFRDSYFMHLSDRAILSRVHKELEVVLPGSSDRILDWSVQRFSHAFPVTTLGAFRRLSALHGFMESGSPLQLAGDYTIYPSFDLAAESGYLAAMRLRRLLGHTTA
ncbi:MAG: FAD-dependent oxidoreductase [Magnetococcales bacterium]|nr:FAD-dependent oxidoreductase [Magnetococcales bacterium]